MYIAVFCLFFWGGGGGGVSGSIEVVHFWQVSMDFHTFSEKSLKWALCWCFDGPLTAVQVNFCGAICPFWNQSCMFGSCVEYFGCPALSSLCSGPSISIHDLIDFK